MKNIKIGVISFEHMHAASYTKELLDIPGVQLAGIADADEYRGTQMAERFGTEYYADYRNLLAESIEGVIICTNNRDHRAISVDAAKSGKHILVEKPFALDLASAELMLKTASEQGVRIMNALPMRFNPSMVEAKRTIDAGEIGEILSITGINHGKLPGGWFIDPARSGGGGVMDHTVHLADLMRYFTGSEFKNVYCESGSLLHDKHIDDCGIVAVEMECGTIATIDCSWAHHKNYPIWPQVDIEIIGTKGSLSVRAFAQVNHLIDAAGNQIEDIVWNEDGDAGLIRAFVQVCRTGHEPCASGVDGARALEVAVAAYKSTKLHARVNVAHIAL